MKKAYVSLLSVRAVEARNLLDQLENKKQKKKQKKKMEKNDERKRRRRMEKRKWGWEVRDEATAGREREGERRRMMEASPLHATAVSPRQKAVCIIMGCHLISFGRRRAGGGGAERSSSARGQEAGGYRSAVFSSNWVLSSFAFGSGVPATGG